MENISRAWCLDTEDLTAGIKNKKGYYIKLGHSISLINALKIGIIFKDKAEEKGVGITDLIYRAV